MTAAGGGRDPDLYQLLGVAREASRAEIAQAWRRRARAEHPDSRPRDAAAPGRFRVLAQAYEVLSDPARRAAYDRALETRPAGRGAEAPVVRVRPPRPARSGAEAPVVRVTPPRPVRPTGPLTGPPLTGPPLWVSPVRVEGPRQSQAADDRDEQEARLARLAGLALWYLAGERDRPW